MGGRLELLRYLYARSPRNSNLVLLHRSREKHKAAHSGAIESMADILRFKISIPEEKLAALKQKIGTAEFPDEVDDPEPWSRGTPLNDLKRLAHYWQNGFDWRAQEAQLNQLPQYITKINVKDFATYDIHFVHQPSSVKNAIPLLFCHGWPGSFMEVTKILPKLIDGGPNFPSFHVVAPSMVDFGFSSRAAKVWMTVSITVTS